jgi:hypothetical protein
MQLSIATPAGLRLSPAAFDDCAALTRLFHGVLVAEPPVELVQQADAAALAQAVWLLIERARALRGFAAGLWCVRGAHEALLGCALVRPAEDGALRHVAVALSDRLQEHRHGLDIVRALVHELDAQLADSVAPPAAAPTLILARATLAELSQLVQEELHGAYGRQRGALREVRLRAREKSAGVVWSAPGRRKEDR